MAEEEITEIFIQGKENYTEVQNEPQPLTYFLYSSPPRGIPKNPTIGDRRPPYQNNVPKPQGVHHFYNMMWDPRVRRGPTYSTVLDRKAEEGRLMKKMMTAKLPPRPPILWDTFTPERKQEIKLERHLPAQLRAKRHVALQMELANQLAEASRLRKRARAKKRKEREEAVEKAEAIKKQKQLETKPDQARAGWVDDFDPNLFSNADDDEQEDEDQEPGLEKKPVADYNEESIRKLSLVSGDSDVELRDDEPSLVELDVDDRPSDDSQDEDEVPRKPKWIFPAVPSLDPSLYSENFSQTFPGDFFLFNEEAKGAVGYLVADAIKSSIYELCAEEEENTMVKRQEEFAIKRQEQLERMAGLQFRTQLVIDERLRLQQDDEIETMLKKDGKDVRRYAMFSSDAAGTVIHDAMKQLETEGFFGDLYLHRVQSQFVPWLSSAVELYARDSLIGYRILDEIVEEVVSKRDEELIYANYKQSRSTKSGSLYADAPRKPSSDSIDDDAFFKS